MIYPLGCNLVIENLQTRQQEFLLGHNNNISCLTISNNGKYIASGQVTFMGFKVDSLTGEINAISNGECSIFRLISSFGIMPIVIPMLVLFYIRSKLKI